MKFYTLSKLKIEDIVALKTIQFYYLLNEAWFQNLECVQWLTYEKQKYETNANML